MPKSPGRRFRLVDVFTARAFAGNQLAVVLDTKGLSTDAMQKITREFNFSESTFVTNADDDSVDVRIFTPGQEVPFAGHPLLGTAHVLMEMSGRSSITLNVKAGAIPIHRV